MSTDASSETRDPRDELATLVAALRAHIEVARAAGTSGLPRAERSARAMPPAASAGSDERFRPTAAVTAGSLPPERARTDSPESAFRRVPEAPAPARPQQSAGSASASSPAPHAAATLPAPATFGPNTEARARLDVLQGEVASCTRCGLHEARTQTVFARGTGSSGVCFVGEGPGQDEDAQGLPFVGKAGQLLDRMILAMGLERDAVYVCNIVKCRPPKNRKPEPSEMTACRPYLLEQLSLIRPAVIVALGATAVEGLLGVGGGITRMRGTWRLYQGAIPVMPTFHPAYLLRNPKAKRDVWSDLQEVMRQVGRPVPARS